MDKIRAGDFVGVKVKYPQFEKKMLFLNSNISLIFSVCVSRHEATVVAGGPDFDPILLRPKL